MLGPLPPHIQMFDFLTEAEHGLLLDWVVANEKNFQPAVVNKGRIGSENRVDPYTRICATTRVIGPQEPMLRDRLLGALDQIMARTGIRLSPDSLELELAAHGDGAFFSAHTDIPVGHDRTPLSDEAGHDRLLSAVYYFHAQPKAFSGGELRLFRFGAEASGSGTDPANHIDLEPTSNSLVAFPSSVLHEVRPVHCPSGAFRDRRFALNCWYCRAL